MLSAGRGRRPGRRAQLRALLRPAPRPSESPARQALDAELPTEWEPVAASQLQPISTESHDSASEDHPDERAATWVPASSTGPTDFEASPSQPDEELSDPTPRSEAPVEPPQEWVPAGGERNTARMDAAQDVDRAADSKAPDIEHRDAPTFSPVAPMIPDSAHAGPAPADDENEADATPLPAVVAPSPTAPDAAALGAGGLGEKPEPPTLIFRASSPEPIAVQDANAAVIRRRRPWVPSSDKPVRAVALAAVAILFVAAGALAAVVANLGGSSRRVASHSTATKPSVQQNAPTAVHHPPSVSHASDNTSTPYTPIHTPHTYAATPLRHNPSYAPATSPTSVPSSSSSSPPPSTSTYAPPPPPTPPPPTTQTGQSHNPSPSPPSPGPGTSGGGH